MNCRNCQTPMVFDHTFGPYRVYVCNNCGTALEKHDLTKTENWTDPKDKDAVKAAQPPQQRGFFPGGGPDG